MATENTAYIPIAVGLISASVALIGAGLSAYFAIVKSKKERLWAERYELTNDLVCDLDTIIYKYGADYLESMGINVVGHAEKKRLLEESSDLMPTIWKNTSRLQILFKRKHIGEILSASTDLNSTFQSLRNITQNDNPSDYLEPVSDAAQKMQDKVIALAQAKCL